ncbi:MAG: phosphoglucosamine mutase [Thermoplasmata archaeon M9B1D]|nr:MAG: phosphoglucosamine mutase [Thermoplasmata archaeon M9B1D]PNX46999.1 MAG: phosphoglucosamine mutase [Thermoplasmata archaeon M8B2D]
MTRLFGTNGIRGVVNQDMNCDLALNIGKAWGTYLRKTLKRPKIAIGTDARLSNDMLKNSISAGLLCTGCDVVDVGIVPTPTLQYTVREKGYDSGVIITASHNPPKFNGIKGVARDGTEFSKDIEEEIEKLYFEKKFNVVGWKEVGKFTTWDGAIDLYIKGILNTVDTSLIKNKKFHVVLDCGNGAGGLVAPILLEKLGCKVTELNCIPDGTFPGHNSEPLPENLTELISKVPKVKADFGVAQDGDADRAIFVDEKGIYIWGDKTLALGAKYATKKNGGIAVTPVTTSSCFDDVVSENNGTVIHTAVGSPIVARVMIQNNSVFGGEENGGLIFPEMQYCRDSAMSIAKILEILAKENRRLSELIDEIPKYEVYKTKMPCPHDKKELVMKKLADQTKKDESVLKVDETDGVKLYLNDGWVLMRPSGTEPIFRVYAESKDKSKAENIAITYKKITEKIIASA